MTRSSVSYQSKAHGASLLEFVLAIPVVALILFSLLEFCRYFYVASALSKGAIDGLYSARVAQYTDARPGTTDYPRYLQILSTIRTKALRIPNLSIGSPDSTRGANYLRFINADYLSGTGVPLSGSQEVILLRPGDAAYITEDGQSFSHPSYPTFVNGDNLFRLLEIHPLIVIMRVRFQSWLPFLDGAVIEGRAVGYREMISDGTYLEQPPPPAPTPTPIGGSPPPPPPPPPPATATPTPTVVQACAADSECNTWCLAQAVPRCGICANFQCLCTCNNCEQGVCAHG
ncbi:MAG: hypothetical protein DCC75_09450 [Proteobacteria bacterium]|nr:MAG: hypothetical protein DCC75_09450 [Pseudomonadota bacterium]